MAEEILFSYVPLKLHTLFLEFFLQPQIDKGIGGYSPFLRNRLNSLGKLLVY
jgi:hypothetical protein